MVSEETVSVLRTKYQALAPLMDERVTRRWAAAAARPLGWAGPSPAPRPLCRPRPPAAGPPPRPAPWAGGAPRPPPEPRDSRGPPSDPGSPNFTIPEPNRTPGGPASQEQDGRASPMAARNSSTISTNS